MWFNKSTSLFKSYEKRKKKKHWPYCVIENSTSVLNSPTDVFFRWLEIEHFKQQYAFFHRAVLLILPFYPPKACEASVHCHSP